MPRDFPHILLDVLFLLVMYFLPHPIRLPYNQSPIQNRVKCFAYLYIQICVTNARYLVLGNGISFKYFGFLPFDKLLNIFDCN